MTVSEKRNTLKDYADTMSPEMLDRVLNFVIKIDGADDAASKNETSSRDVATIADVDAALAKIDKKYAKDMEILAQ